MGLDAYVYCNCYREGRAAPFPLPDVEKYFYFDESGWLDLHYDGVGDLEHQQFSEWIESACDHPDMEYASVHVANWSGYTYFMSALRRVGEDEFPTLREEVPDDNTGTTTPENAARMLKELQRFRDSDLGEGVFLVNSKTGDVVQRYIEAYGGVFLLDSRTGVDIGIDQEGFFIVNHIEDETVSTLYERLDPSEVLFRATRFEQRLLEMPTRGAPGRVEYYNADTEARFICTSATGMLMNDGTGQLRMKYPRLLHVEQRQVTDDEYAYILKPLETICRASIETGNPIIWC